MARHTLQKLASFQTIEKYSQYCQGVAKDYEKNFYSIVTLVLHNFLLRVCREIDQLDPDYVSEAETKKLDCDYEITSIELKDLCDQLADVLTM